MPVRIGLAMGLLVAGLATASAPAPAQFGPTDAITIAGLRRHLRFIASDALEGREALSPGFQAAAEYIAAALDGLGATPAGDMGTYFQHVGIRRTTVDVEAASVIVGDGLFRYGDDFLVTASGDASGDLVYVGQGYRIPSRHVDPYAGLDARGRVLMVVPPPNDLESLRRGVDYTTPDDNARELGAAGIVSVASFQQLAAWTRSKEIAVRGRLDVDRLTPPGHVVPTVVAGPRLVSALFRGEREDGAKIATRATDRNPGASFALKAGKSITLHLPSISRIEDTTNVIAIVEGSDPVLRNEYVALGAHLDHLGRHPAGGPSRGARGTPSAAAPLDEIYNGADDDGSGVVALLEMAEAVASGPRPKRSLLFVWHTGEEMGSLGAKYFTAFPTVPLDHIIAQLNVDMIGRSRPPGDNEPDDAVLTGPNEVYVVGSRRLSQELGDVCDRVDRAFLGLAVNYKYDAPDDPERIYERSDHYEYAQKGIPVAFFFTGLHADYHRVTDEVGRIDFDKLQRVARTVLATAWTLANAPERPRLDHPGPVPTR
jgi:hypothetical protein